MSFFLSPKEELEELRAKREKLEEKAEHFRLIKEERDKLKALKSERLENNIFLRFLKSFLSYLRRLGRKYDEK